MVQQTNSSLSSLFLMFTVFWGFYACEAKTKDFSAEVKLVASTPGDEPIKALLAIPPETKVDFIRWNLTLIDAKPGKQSFTLQIHYGEGQPNTLGFKNDGEKRSVQGEYSVSHNEGPVNREVYHLKSPKLSADILMVKLSDNLFHLLTPQEQLMTGNGGWSYTLNRKGAIVDDSLDLPTFTMASALTEDTASQVVFEGRTPCVEIARENNLPVVPGCFKLKWKLILNKDSQTLAPTTYILKRTDHRQSDITGRWAIVKGTASAPNVIIYQLDPDKPEQSISLLLGDHNVAFFLHKDNQFFVGNEDFSYTLNRRQ